MPNPNSWSDPAAAGRGRPTTDRPTVRPFRPTGPVTCCLASPPPISNQLSATPTPPSKHCLSDVQEGADEKVIESSVVGPATARTDVRRGKTVGDIGADPKRVEILPARPVLPATPEPAPRRQEPSPQKEPAPVR